MDEVSNPIFEHGQVVRIDYGCKEYWIETMVIRNSDKKYFTATHRKSHPCVECPSQWKITSLEAYGRVVLDLRVP